MGTISELQHQGEQSYKKSLMNIGYGSKEFSAGRVHLHLTIKRVGIIVIEIERMRIHFLSDVFVAVAVMVS